ncbi:FUSC family protein [Fodinibius saliphilus]|uniref:FUSC family protein n=1 Tax=Fodinibius saliphilus TaxID=1920650 RepID=UPI00110850E5|nr:FUSC family membrane protein [Fodinibius saliphilus]
MRISDQLQQAIEYLRDVFQGEQFYLSLRHATGALIPLVISEMLGYPNIGLEMMLGAFFVSGVDIAGTFQSKAKALLITTALSISITFLLLVAGGQQLLVLVLLFLFIFGLAYISPFSLRYSLMGIMGYLAIILAISMIGRFDSVSQILHHCFLLLCGSLWYITYALVIHFFAGTRAITRRLARCMRQTTHYFQQRVTLVEPDVDHTQGIFKLAELQQELNETQESVRELLFSNTSLLSGRSSERRRYYLIFIELVDMHELAMATPIDYPKVRDLLHQYPEYNIIREVIDNIHAEMNLLADVLLNNREYENPLHLQDEMDTLEQYLARLKQEVFSDEDHNEEAYHTLKRLEIYLHKQLQKVEVIQNAVLDYRTYYEEPEENDRTPYTDLSTTDLPQFVTPNPLNWNSTVDNFSFDSSYFRYALRTATTAVAGYSMAHFLGFENAYWVLLTVLVVMKPGYGVTSQRFFHRIIGTLIGAAIAYGLYLLDPSHVASLIIFGVSLTLAFTFVVRNYVIASSFFTIFVIFMYSFLNREIPSMVVFRVVDTIVGAVLVIGAVRFLWPSWEYQKFPALLRKSLFSNKLYLQEVLNHLFEGSFDEKNYRLTRKEAYVDIANVISSYHRLANDPESKQKGAQFSYDLALLNYMILSTTTSLGIFLQRHPNESFHYPEFQTIGEGIQKNLELSIQYLAYSDSPTTDEGLSKSEKIEEASEELSKQIYTLKRQIDRQNIPTDSSNKTYLRYAHINYLSRQLRWILELSRSILNRAAYPERYPDTPLTANTTSTN